MSTEAGAREVEALSDEEQAIENFLAALPPEYLGSFTPAEMGDVQMSIMNGSYLITTGNPADIEEDPAPESYDLSSIFETGQGTIYEVTRIYPEEPVCTDEDEDSFFAEGGECGPVDCRDNNSSVNPDATERCNYIDDDCDGRIDEGVRNACGTCGSVPEEVCDGVDNDCDGFVDEGGVCDGGSPG